MWTHGPRSTGKKAGKQHLGAEREVVVTSTGKVNVDLHKTPARASHGEEELAHAAPPHDHVRWCQAKDRSLDMKD